VYSPGSQTITHKDNPPKHLVVDHAAELQTGKEAAKGQKFTPNTMKGIKDKFNHPGNLILVPPKLNLKKAVVTKQVLAGKPANPTPETKAYMKAAHSYGADAVSGLPAVHALHQHIGESTGTGMPPRTPSPPPSTPSDEEEYQGKGKAKAKPRWKP